MVRPPDLYCKICLNTERNEDDLFELLRGIVPGTVFLNSIDGSQLEVSLMRNEHAPNHQHSREFPEFLFYRFFVDVDPAENTPRDAYVAAVGTLLRNLWTEHIDAVAACSFESELPARGLSR